MNIGYSSLGGTPTPISGNTGRLLYGTGQQAVLTADQEVFRCFVGYAGANNSAVATFQLGIYDVSGGNYSTAPRLYAVTLTINNAVEGANSTPRWIEFPLTPLNMSGHAGKTLAVGFADSAANMGFTIPLVTVTGANRKNHSGANSVLPATMANGSVTANQAWSMYFETRTIAAGGQTLDSVSPDPVTSSESLTAIISGELAPGDVDLVSGSIEVAQSVASWAFNSASGKTTVVTPVTQGGLAFGSVTARYSSGGTELSDTVVLQPVAGNIQVAITGGVAQPGYIFEQLESGNVANVSHIEHTDSPNTVVSAQGAITQTIVRPFQARARDGSDNTWSAFATIITAAVAEPVGVAAQGAVGAATVSVIAVARPAGVVGVTALGAVAVSAGGVAKPVGVAAVGRVGLVGSSQSAAATPQGVSGVAMLGVVTASGEVVPAIARPSGVRGVGRVGFFLRVSPPVTVGSFVIPDVTVIGATAFIEKVEGDTRGINIQFVQNSKHLTLAGWSGFELVVDARKNPTDSSTRQFLTAGVVVDELKGRVYFPVSGDIVAGKYYFNARCVTPAGERFTFMRGNYQVVDSIQ